MHDCGNGPPCGVCDSKLVKNGFTSGGRQRWRCDQCGASKVQDRADIRARAQGEEFHAWLLGSRCQRSFGGTGRSFRDRTSWCWDIQVPGPRPTGQVHDQVIVDGTYFQGWCVIIATNGQQVIGWQWCARQSKAAYRQLLQQLPPPKVVVTDGGTGLRAALGQVWPRTQIQRCYFHIYTNIRRLLTCKPRLEAGQELWKLTQELMQVRTIAQAANWMGRYGTWEARWEGFLKERTWAKSGQDRPRQVAASATWWYTHRHLRTARASYRRLLADQSLFTFLHQPAPTQITRVTSSLEGGVNKKIKDLLRAHRGLKNQHARTAIDWLLNSLTEHPHDPWQLANDHLKNPAHSTQATPVEEPLGPAQYDTGITTDEGLWIRKGWAGRSH